MRSLTLQSGLRFSSLPSTVATQPSVTRRSLHQRRVADALGDFVMQCGLPMRVAMTCPFLKWSLKGRGRRGQSSPVRSWRIGLAISGIRSEPAGCSPRITGIIRSVHAR